MLIINLIEKIVRKVDVRIRLTLIFTLIIAAVTGLMGIYATSVVADRIIFTAEQKLESDLAMGEQIIDYSYPGPWQLINGHLYKGTILMEENYEVIDQIGDLTGDTVTIFRGDTRVSTNVIQDNVRMINTQVSEIVKQAVLINGESYVGEAIVVGTKNLTAYKPIKDTSGKIIGIWYVGVPATPYDKIVSDFRNSMIIYSAIGILLAFLVALLLSYTVYKPLQRIEEAVRIASEGDLTHAIPVVVEDELGRLAVMFNIMIEKISELIRKTKDLTTNVHISSEELLNRSELSAELMQGMTMQANEMTNTAARQAELAGQSRVAMGEMSSAIQLVAENAQEVSQSAVLATNRAQEGQNQIEKAINQIEVISSTVNSTEKIIQGLGMKSQEITQIVDLITNIANQTNLLALNAAIEAARAGEQGRGFAVVAEEVRQLAEESGYAAKQIAELIKEIQNEADKAVRAMETGTREVANGTEAIGIAGETFNQIIKAISLVNEQIQEMSAVSQQMAASSEIAIEAIEATTQEASSNAKAAQGINELAAEQMAGVEEINASVDGLNQIIEALEGAIGRFKV